MWSPTALAPTSGALEADIAAQFTPVRWIERPQLRADRHGYRALLARASCSRLADLGTTTPTTPMHPMMEMRAALQRMADTGDAGEEIVLEYRNRPTGDADDCLPHAIAASRRKDQGEATCLSHELSFGRRRRLLDRWRPAARLGRQGCVHGADVDFLRARQQWRPARPSCSASATRR